MTKKSRNLLANDIWAMALITVFVLKGSDFSSNVWTWHLFYWYTLSSETSNLYDPLDLDHVLTEFLPEDENLILKNQLSRLLRFAFSYEPRDRLQVWLDPDISIFLAEIQLSNDDRTRLYDSRIDRDLWFCSESPTPFVNPNSRTPLEAEILLRKDLSERILLWNPNISQTAKTRVLNAIVNNYLHGKTLANLYEHRLLIFKGLGGVIDINGVADINPLLLPLDALFPARTKKISVVPTTIEKRNSQLTRTLDDISTVISFASSAPIDGDMTWLTTTQDGKSATLGEQRATNLWNTMVNVLNYFVAERESLGEDLSEAEKNPQVSLRFTTQMLD